MTWDDNGGGRDFPLIEPPRDFAHRVLARVTELEALRAQERAPTRGLWVAWVLAILGGLAGAFIATALVPTPFHVPVRLAWSALADLAEAARPALGWMTEAAQYLSTDALRVDLARWAPSVGLTIALAFAAVALADWIMTWRVLARRADHG